MLSFCLKRVDEVKPSKGHYKPRLLNTCSFIPQKTLLLLNENKVQYSNKNRSSLRQTQIVVPGAFMLFYNYTVASHLLSIIELMSYMKTNES